MNKGFTLVELLAVLVLLAAISTIVVVSVGTIIDSAETSLTAQQKRNIEKAAEQYYLERVGDETDYCVSLSTLISEGYISDSSVLDPSTKEAMVGYVRITYTSNQYRYTYQDTSCISD